MSYYEIKEEQFHQSGEIPVFGAKNSAIKLLPASVLIEGEVILHNIPEIEDIKDMVVILESLGAKVERLDHHSYRIDTTSISKSDIPFELATKMRASFLFIAPLLIRFGRVEFPHPGGDAIGRRPIDMTLEILACMGAEVRYEQDRYIFELSSGQTLHGIDYVFKWISHTSTELLIMAAVRAQGITRIYNAALEPEIQVLCDMLRQAGAKIDGDGTSSITIKGVPKLHAVEVTNIPDRLEVGTFAILGAITRSDLLVTNTNPLHLTVFWKFLTLAGVDFELGDTWVRMTQTDKPFKAIEVKTHEYPGFVTDLQAPFTVLLTQAEGFSQVQETIFDGRLYYTDTLRNMGANIIMCDPYRVVINGPTQLYGQKIESPDVRAGMAYLLAALIAKNETQIHNIHHIDRGYEQIEERLQKVGFAVNRVE